MDPTLRRERDPEEAGEAEMDRVTTSRPALFEGRIAELTPAEPVCVVGDVTVQAAVERMLERHQAAVLVVDTAGRLTGVFTERDVLRRVLGRGLDPATTPVAAVMTPDPEALTVADRIAYALHCTGVAGYRTIPLIDAARRPIGILTVTDLVRWLAESFPEDLLNLPPGDRLRHPETVDGP